jgi:uncharacterized protein
MKLREDTVRIQHLLGEYCRTGEMTELPGITPDRVHHYRRLVYHVVKGTMDTAFPITRSALDEDTWDSLVREFFASRQARSPQVWKLPFEFYRFHEERGSGDRLGKPYLDDLLYFEWIEIEVHTMPDRDFPAYRSEGDLFHDPLAFNPEHEVIRLEYPVHLYPAEQCSTMKGEYYAIVFRIPESGSVRFLDLSPLYIYLVSRMEEEKIPLIGLMDDLSGRTGVPHDQLRQSLEKFLTDLFRHQLIVGYLKQ